MPFVNRLQKKTTVQVMNIHSTNLVIFKFGERFEPGNFEVGRLYIKSCERTEIEKKKKKMIRLSSQNKNCGTWISKGFRGS